ncbi:MAG TPA: SDR family NAD(P)-dependent oxidoreductase [Candidatus Baltobacteraceae bacterium]|nr:SDR family NAD(P)-dependent oxidoreductase [Candidatus Baltobacteraceae bacterium]
MGSLQDRVAVVTGGSRGIGKAIAQALVGEGAKVAICARNADDIRKAADEISPGGGRVLGFATDITDQSAVRGSVQKIVARWGQIHILVNNAGINARVPIDSEDDAAWRAVLDSTILGAYYMTREVLRHMPKQVAPESPGGRIVNLSSVLGRFGAPGYTAYCTAKHGMIGFTRALALEVVDRGITVNAICPGWVETEMARSGMRATGASMGISENEFRKQALAAVPIQRILQPKEIADLVLYLVSDAASGMTGQALNLCGGQVMS